MSSLRIEEVWDDDVAWVEPQNSRYKVDCAGSVLAQASDILNPEYDEALLVVNNWRASHNFPLNTFQVNLRNAARSIDGNCIVAQRIKRLASIKDKLCRFSTMKLSQMQDIGGCRAVVDNVGNVRKLHLYYTEESRIKHELCNLDHYIDSPKASGYRGIHLIYRYYSDKKQKVWNGLKIEMQLRSRYQHAWATAVETVGLFISQALKSSIGEKQWLRFFALMGSEIALKEKCPPVPNLPTDREELRSQIRKLSKKLKVEPRLQNYNAALRAVEGNIMPRAHFYLLELIPQENVIYFSGFMQQQVEEASNAYAEAEKRVLAKQGDAVLVSVDSVTALRRAYPNYFADTTVFLKLLKQALA